MTAPSSLFQRWIPPLAGIVLGGVFLVAAFLKGADPKAFVEQIASFKIITGSLATLAAYTLVPVEFILAAALIVGYRRRLAAVATGLLLLFFIGVTAYGWAIGKTEGCGCFGSLAPRGPGEVIVEDLLFLGLAALAALPIRRPRPATDVLAATDSDPAGGLVIPDGSPARGLVVADGSPAGGLVVADGSPAGGASLLRGAGVLRETGILRGASVAVVAIAAVAFELAAPRLPLDDLVTALRPGRPVTALDLGLDEKASELVALVDLKAPDIEGTVAALNAVSSLASAPKVVAFAAATEQERGEFFWSRGPAFELHEASAPTLRTLARRLPRFFLTRQGRVERTWNDGPPRPEELAALLK